MQMAMFSRTVKASEISRMILVNVRTSCICQLVVRWIPKKCQLTAK